MRKISLFIMVFLMIASEAWSAGSCVITSNTRVPIPTIAEANDVQRQYVVLTCTGDSSNGSITAYSFVPATFGVKGWYLYNVTTDPDGSHAPTADYDITLLVGGEDIAGSLLLDRSTSATQTVAIAPTTQGYPMADGTMAITFENQNAASAVVVMTLRFTTN